MSEYQMSIEGKISYNDCMDIYDYMSVVGCDDKVVISFTEEDQSIINIVLEILENQDFKITDKYKDEKGTYKIAAVKC